MNRKVCRVRRYDTGTDEPQGLSEPVSFFMRGLFG